MIRAEMVRGNWTDNECYYVSVVDGPRCNLLLGPFRTHQEAIDRVDKVMDYSITHDRRGVFYSYGTVKTKNGYREGLLNKVFNW